MALLPHQLSTVPGSPVIWGETANLEFFVNGVTVITDKGGVDKEVTYAQSTVHRYPGDPAPFVRKGGKRRIYTDPASSSVGTPGKRFWLEFLVPEDEFLNEIRQFTVVGSTGLLRAQIKTAAKFELYFRSTSGRKWLIPKPGVGGP